MGKTIKKKQKKRLLGFIKGIKFIFTNKFFTLVFLLVGLPLILAGVKYQQDIQGRAANTNTAAIVAKQTTDLATLIKQFAVSTDKNKLSSSIEALVYQRKLNLTSLMQTNPTAVIDNANTILALQPLINLLPDTIKNNLEKQTSIQGKVEVTIGEDFAKNTQTISTSLTTDTKDVYAIYNSKYASAGGNAKYTVKGILVGEDIALQKSTFLSSFKSSSGQNQTIAVIFINQHPDINAQDILLHNVEPYLKAASFNKETFNQNIFVDYLNIDYATLAGFSVPTDGNKDQTKYLCSQVFRDQLANFVDSNVGTSNYSHVIYSFAHIDCPADGWGNNPGSRIWINGYANGLHIDSPENWARAIRHEIGHNFGMEHADTYICYSGNQRLPIAVTSQCSSGESSMVFDKYDPMGNWASDLNFLYNNYHKLQVGWLTDSNVISLSPGKIFTPSACQGNICKLSPAEQNSKPSIIKIPANRSINGQPMYYYLEYRQAIGSYDASGLESVHDGIAIRLAGSKEADTHSYLVAAADGYNDILKKGMSFYDPSVPVKIEVTDLASGLGGFASVRVSFTQDLGTVTKCGDLGGTCMQPVDFGRNKGMCSAKNGIQYTEDVQGSASCQNSGGAGQDMICCVPKIAPTPTQAPQPAPRQNTCAKVAGQVCAGERQTCGGLKGDYTSADSKYQCTSTRQTCCRPATCADFHGTCTTLRTCIHQYSVSNNDPHECDKLGCDNGLVCGF